MPETIPWDQRLARALVPALARAGVGPNTVSTVSLLLAVGAGVLYALGDRAASNWAAGFFVLARFIDHADGELARRTGRSSRFGYYYDYVVGALSSVALFAGMGLGLRAGGLGEWALGMGLAAGALALVGMVLGLVVDARGNGEAGGYPGAGGFELEDGIYLVAPITWLGGILPFFVCATTGQAIFSAWMLARVVRTRDARVSPGTSDPARPAASPRPG